MPITPTQPVFTACAPSTVDNAEAGKPASLPPYSPIYDDIYHPQAGAWGQAQHVFLQGNGLPARWQGRTRFVVLETGFGLGNNFLATWAAWLADPLRCAQLVFISIEKHPLSAADLRRAHEASDVEQALASRLSKAWPPLTPGLHVLDFDEPALDASQAHCGVTLLLGLGDVSELLPALLAAVDAFYLDGFAPAKNPQMWSDHLLSRLNRLAAPGATAATWSAARSVRDSLTHAGFEVTKAPGFGDKRDMTRAVFQPRFTPPPLPGGLWPAPPSGTTNDRHAVVIGAGLAGCAAAWALTREGWRVSLIEQHDGAAQEASGNPGGLFHSIVHGRDSIHARAHRAAALLTAALAGPWIETGRIQGQCKGLLRLDTRITDQEAHALLTTLGEPTEHVCWLDQAAARQRSGIEVPSGGWLFQQGGWLDPAGYAQAMLDEARRTGLLSWLGEQTACQLARLDDGTWAALDRQGCTIAQAPAMVLANAMGASTLARTLDSSSHSQPKPAALPLAPSRGQITAVWPQTLQASAGCLPHLPVAGGGYVLAMPDGGLLCGATAHVDDTEPALRSADHRHNLMQAAAMGAIAPIEADQALPAPLGGRVGWRATTPDRLPLVGAWPMAPPGTNSNGTAWPDQVRRVPRLRNENGGLFVLSGLGSRGITWAALAGRLLSHWVTGSPCPLEADLRDALDPARFGVRESRVKSGHG